MAPNKGDPVSQMEKKLVKILLNSPSIGTLLKNGDAIRLPNWYIAAGAIPTVVWNSMVCNPPELFLKDIDIVYHDENELSEKGELQAGETLRDLFPEINCKIDVKNQARVHTWYRDKNGDRIPQYPATEAGIGMWMPVTAIGVRYKKGRFYVYAPYGLEDLFSMTVKPNPCIISEEHYNKKVKKWKKQWPELRVQSYENHQ